MSVWRLLAIAVLVVLASVAWLILGTSLVPRTGEFDSRLREDVVRLGGGEYHQAAPAVRVERPRQVTEQVTPSVPMQATARVNQDKALDHDARDGALEARS
ncbi:MAG TPA: hypothetical protein VF198_19000 [Vicinamibacterales bacterium]